VGQFARAAPARLTKTQVRAGMVFIRDYRR
jgi:hypothetical protein